jgi:hypothetical protein
MKSNAIGDADLDRLGDDFFDFLDFLAASLSFLAAAVGDQR